MVRDWIRNEFVDLLTVPEELDISYATTAELALADLSDVEVLCTLSWFPSPGTAPNLRLVHLISSGSDQLDRSVFGSAIPVSTSRGANAVGVAEFVFASLLSWQRRIRELALWQESRQWPEEPVRMRRFVARRDLVGATIGIVGYGTVGRRVASVARAFGMRVIAVNSDGLRKPADDPYAHEGDEYCVIPEAMAGLDDLSALDDVDVLCLCLPLTDRTRGAFDAAFFSRLRRQPYLIDVSRGGVCDSAALTAALEEGRIAGAAVDVFDPEPLPLDDPRWRIEGIAMSPHVAAHSDLYERRIAELVIENSLAVLRGQEPKNRVRM